MSYIFSGTQSGVRLAFRTPCQSAICKPRTGKGIFMFQNLSCLPGFCPATHGFRA